MEGWVSAANPAFAGLAKKRKSSCHCTPIKRADFFHLIGKLEKIFSQALRNYPLAITGRVKNHPP
jgi:hypothetical protein